MDPTKLSRRDTLGAAIGVASFAFATTTANADSAKAQTPTATPLPGAPGSKWLLFTPTTGDPTRPQPLAAAIDASTLVKAVAVTEKLVLTMESARGAYAIEINFAADGAPADVMMKILSGDLRDLRDEANLKITAVKVKDASAGNGISYIDASERRGSPTTQRTGGAR